MASNYQRPRSVKKIHWIWVILAVIAIAIPLTLFISSQNTDNRQHAASNDNPVINLQLSGECKGKNEPNNSYRRAKYICQNGANGDLPNNNNSCDKRADWMDKAVIRCRNQATPPTAAAVPPSNATPTQTVIVDPISDTPSPSLTTSITPNPLVLNCSAVGDPNFGNGGAMIAAQLVHSNGNPIYNATISWKTEPALVNTQGFSQTTKTAPQGNGATRNFVAPGQGSLTSVVVTASHEYTIPGTETHATAECKVTLSAH